MASIFISYNRESANVAMTLVADLEALGHLVWYDQELSGGQPWWDKIIATVQSCDIFVFILDPESLKSTACKREYEYAAALDKPILPILVSGDISTNLLPPALSMIQFVDYREQDRKTAFSLARALTAVPPPKPLPDPLPRPPEVPISYLSSISEQIETTSTMTFEAQSAVVVDLKRGMRDLETANDVRTLLQKLRKRRDLYAPIAEEIDDLIDSATPFGQHLVANWKKTLGYGVLLAGLVVGAVLAYQRLFPAPSAVARVPAEMSDFVDPDTDLMWTTMDNGQRINWSGANSYCESFSLSGHQDWRLPTIEEIKKLYVPGNGRTYNIREPIELTHPWILSSTTEGSSFYWGFKFNDGNGYKVGIDKAPGRALCVRSADD